MTDLLQDIDAFNPTEAQCAELLRWADALEDEKYKPAAGMLRGSDACFCCLGVAADIAGATWENSAPFIDGRDMRDEEDEYLDERWFKERTGLSYKHQQYFAKLNDEFMHTSNRARGAFPEIAGIIRKSLEALK